MLAICWRYLFTVRFWDSVITSLFECSSSLSDCSKWLLHVTFFMLDWLQPLNWFFLSLLLDFFDIISFKTCADHYYVSAAPIHHFPPFYNKLHLADAGFARTQTGFGIGQTMYFSFINRNVSIKQIILTCYILFPISCLQTEKSSQSI